MKYRALLAALLVALAPLAYGIDFTRAQAGRISQFVGQILATWHYRQTPLNDQVSAKFLKHYIDTLDYNHLIFLQADIEEFEKMYGAQLDDEVLKGNVAPAYRIFDRYLLRLGERKAMVDRLLKEEYDFSKDESIVAARNKAPFPKDEKEAEDLWRGRLKYELLSGKLNKEKAEETLKRIAKRYERMERTMREYDSEEILQTYLGALAHAYDPHSDYLSPTEATNFKIQHISLKLSGIGATLQWDDGYTKIVSLVPGGPAALSKQLKPGDKVTGVAQGDGEFVDVVEMRLNKVVQMIRGKRGTVVRLQVIPADAGEGSGTKIVTIERDEIKLKEQMAKSRVYDHVTPDGKTVRLGVVNLPQFYDNCADHVALLINRMKKENVEGIVLDLRRNGGGILEESVALTGLFLKKGPVVQVRSSDQKVQLYEDRDNRTVWDGPLVVMVGRLSASASEITAAALQDHGRALVIGDQATHGKGTVQQVLDLERWMKPDPTPNPGELKITVSKFYRIAGGTTQKQGMQPDIVLPSVYDYLDIGEASLDNALEPDNIKPADYKAMELVAPYVKDLSERSKTRVGQSKDFAYLLEDIEEVKKRKEDKTVSLNEAKRIAEKETATARTEARKKERAERKTPKDKSYVLDLETAEKGTPMALYQPKKKDESAEKKDAEPVIDLDAEEDGDDIGYDAQLNEGLNILNDYRSLLAGKSLKENGNVALKDSPSTANATP